MSIGDDRRRSVDVARSELQKRRIAAAAKLSLDDRLHCDEGWRTIVQQFVRVAERPGFVLISAGEKWGALRLRYSCENPEEVAAAERHAVEQSTRTCEVCGRAGELRRSGWWKTMCDFHRTPENRWLENVARPGDE